MAEDWYFEPQVYHYDEFLWLCTCLVGASFMLALLPDLSGNGVFDTRNEPVYMKGARSVLVSILLYCLGQAILYSVPLYWYHFVLMDPLFGTKYSYILGLMNYVSWFTTMICSIKIIYYAVTDLNKSKLFDYNIAELFLNLPLVIINLSYSYIMDYHIDSEWDWYPIFDYL